MPYSKPSPDFYHSEMQRRGKRKQPQPQPSPSPPPKSVKTAAEPYPHHRRPTPDECRALRDDLLALHGFPKEFATYRSQRLNGLAHTPAKSEPSDGEDYGGPSYRRESVLDGLVGTILSQNTTDSNSRRAFASLKSAFPTWEHVSFFLFLSHSIVFVII